MEMSQKKSHKFVCEKCCYKTDNKSDYNKHILTLKHKNTTKYNINVANVAKKSDILFTCNCGKSYPFRASLYNHKKKCTFIQNNENNENNIDSSLVIKNNENNENNENKENSNKPNIPLPRQKNNLNRTIRHTNPMYNQEDSIYVPEYDTVPTDLPNNYYDQIPEHRIFINSNYQKFIPPRTFANAVYDKPENV